ncbi:MAG: hypothetical protein P8Z31_12610, partial [Gammaproteobacteria bacterium]
QSSAEIAEFFVSCPGAKSRMAPVLLKEFGRRGRRGIAETAGFWLVIAWWMAIVEIAQPGNLSRS